MYWENRRKENILLMHVLNWRKHACIHTYIHSLFSLVIYILLLKKIIIIGCPLWLDSICIMLFIYSVNRRKENTCPVQWNNTFELRILKYSIKLAFWANKLLKFKILFEINNFYSHIYIQIYKIWRYTKFFIIIIQKFIHLKKLYNIYDLFLVLSRIWIYR